MMPVPESLTLVCLKWGEKYGADYVAKLAAMVRRNLTIPYRFVCITDNPHGLDCETVPLVRDLPAWWGKLTLFSHPLPGRLLFFDLDTVITGNIDGFAAYRGPFCIIKPFYRQRGYASGVMSIAPNFGKHVWKKFGVNPPRAIEYCRTHADPPWNNGDQRWLELTVPKADYWQDLLPGQLFSYKTQCQSGLPQDARVVCFHGTPNPHEVSDPWVKEHWRV